MLHNKTQLMTSLDPFYYQEVFEPSYLEKNTLLPLRPSGITIPLHPYSGTFTEAMCEYCGGLFLQNVTQPICVCDECRRANDIFLLDGGARALELRICTAVAWTANTPKLPPSYPGIQPTMVGRRRHRASRVYPGNRALLFVLVQRVTYPSDQLVEFTQMH